MRTRRILLPIICVLFMCGCGYEIPNLPVRQQKPIKEQEPTQEIESEKNEVTDQSLELDRPKRVVRMIVPANSLGNLNYAENTIKIRMEEFMKEYPDIDVQLEIIPCTVDIQDTTYPTKVAVCLASGEEIDLISTSRMNVCKYARAGYFEDLYSFMETDTELTKDSYYSNILEAIEVDHKLYQLPNVVCYQGYTLNSKYEYLVEKELYEKDSLTIYDIKKVFDSVKKGLSDNETFYPYIRYGASQMLQRELYSPSFFDNEDKYVNINSEVLDLLHFIKEDAIPPTDVNYGIEVSDPFLFLYGNETIRLSAACFPYHMIGEGFWLQETTHGDIPFTISESYAMNTNGQNKEDAWTIMKYLSSDVYKNFIDYAADYMPGRKDEFWNSFVPYYKEQIRWLLSEDRGNTELLNDSEYMDGLFEQINHCNGMLNCFVQDDDTASIIMDAVFRDYDLDLIDEEELIMRLQEKLTMYVNE